MSASAEVVVVGAGERPPDEWTGSLFLAGPTPRDPGVASWRPAAMAEIRSQWTGRGRLVVFVPEPSDGRPWPPFERQAQWEHDGLNAAGVILFWIPRDVRTLPGFTTNVEFGLFARSGRVVLGCPPDCPNPERNRYLIWTAGKFGIPVRETLPDTIATALAMIHGT